MATAPAKIQTGREAPPRAAADFRDAVFFKTSEKMEELPDNSVHLVVTSPPYFNIKDYSKDGYQNGSHSQRRASDLGGIDSYESYLQGLLKVWQECERVLVPNGKMCVNVPLMPIPKRSVNTHYNRHIYDLQSDIQHSILGNTKLFLLDLYIWQRTNSSKKLMFGSYPYPRNLYAQNTAEFITVYVKDGAPQNDIPRSVKKKSRLTQEEWREYTQQVWNFSIPGRGDLAFGKHAAIMPEELAKRCIRLYSYAGETVLDPFAGSGTTLRVAKTLERRYVGYEIYPAYKAVIEQKLQVGDLFNKGASERADQ